ncbi:MAG: prolipoprotein diacylglyceryl transferase [Eubacteriales bacterium]|nr:prolipoprotein diacylglyceryl transferase [Eubacteriales bacterium]
MSIHFPNLGLHLEYVGKSVHILGFEITIYGMLIAAGMLLGIAFVVLEAKRSNQNQDMYLDFMILALIAAVIGARLCYVIFNWKLYRGNILEILNTRNGGMAIYGGILGGALAGALFCRIKKLPFWEMADIICMGLLIGQIIGRWGDFFNRQSFGKYTEAVTAMQLPLSAVHAGEVTAEMRENLATIGNVNYIQVHPAFLYESLWCLFLFILLMAYRRRKKFEGEIAMRYLAGYGFGRFFIEGLRTDAILIPGTKLPAAQIISAVLFVVFGTVVFVRRFMVKKREAARKRRREKIYQEEEKAASEYNDDWIMPTYTSGIVSEKQEAEPEESEPEQVETEPESEPGESELEQVETEPEAEPGEPEQVEPESEPGQSEPEETEPEQVGTELEWREAEPEEAEPERGEAEPEEAKPGPGKTERQSEETEPEPGESESASEKPEPKPEETEPEEKRGTRG